MGRKMKLDGNCGSKFITIDDEKKWALIREIATVDRYKNSFNAIVNDALMFGLDENRDRLFNTRVEAIRALRGMTSVKAAMGSSDEIRREILSLAKDLPKTGRLSYGSKDMEAYVGRVDKIVEMLIGYQGQARRSHLRFLDELEKLKQAIKNICGTPFAFTDRNVKVEEVERDLPKYHNKIDEKTLSIIEDIEADYSVIYAAVEKAGERISGDPKVLTAEETCTYKRTQEIMRYSNEISRLTASPNPSFKAGKKLILECASLKFQACRENKGASYTNRILQLTKNKKYDIDYISDVVSKIIVEKDGTVIVEMINGAKICSKEVDNAGASEKSCNEDRRQSDSCRAE